MSYQSFENLEVGKKACCLAVKLYDCLRDQMQRSAISIASNIAEGAERGSDKDFIRFLHYSKGSAGELRTQLYISDKIGIIKTEFRKELCQELTEISKMLHSLIKFKSLDN